MFVLGFHRTFHGIRRTFEGTKNVLVNNFLSDELHNFFFPKF
jgi:hypothetical protein